MKTYKDTSTDTHTSVAYCLLHITEFRTIAILLYPTFPCHSTNLTFYKPMVKRQFDSKYKTASFIFCLLKHILLSNCFFTIGLKTFCQIIGLPVGSDPAPFFAGKYKTVSFTFFLLNYVL